MENFHHPHSPLPLWQVTVTVGKNYTSSDARKFTPTLAQFIFFRVKIPIVAGKVGHHRLASRWSRNRVQLLGHRQLVGQEVENDALLHLAVHLLLEKVCPVEPMQAQTPSI